MSQFSAALLLFVISGILGGLPLTGWLVKITAGRNLRQVGTGNVGVSAAFYHGGTLVGVLAVLAEAAKGILAVLLAQALLPQSFWQLLALVALVIGRYYWGRGAGTTNVVWGCVTYDWRVALLIFLVGGISFTILRERQRGRIGVLILLPLIIALLRANAAETVAAMVLSGVLGWIYQHLPDDLDLAAGTAAKGSQTMFKFFRGDRAVLSLDQSLEATRVGNKAATLSQLRRWGYSVPLGWVLPPGDDPEPLIESLFPTVDQPLAVRSSAIGEDTEQASAAGQYRTILGVTSRSALLNAITECQSFYNDPQATQYRQDRGDTSTGGMAVLVQTQIKGVFSGVAFSRDPVSSQAQAVAVECLPGEAKRVVSGRVTPERYQVLVPEAAIHPEGEADVTAAIAALKVEGEPGDVPLSLVREVAWLCREIEQRYHGVPQDIEWTFDGERLWLLQARPITTLLPIWTRKIAAEVIPGVIRPLTWSINRPLTCGVWGSLFATVLGRRVRGLAFEELATLHYGRAYFNASLLGQLFRRMGLPAKSLEFLTRGSPMGKPAPRAMVQNLPGLLRLLDRELGLKRAFIQDRRQLFGPTLQELQQQSVTTLTPAQLGERIEQILRALRAVTGFSILAPLSAALRQNLLRIPDDALDAAANPETAALRSLQAIAADYRGTGPAFIPQLREESWSTLADDPQTAELYQRLCQFLEQYGYLSEVATDIAVPTWREHPQPVFDLLAQLLQAPLPPTAPRQSRRSWQTRVAQARLQLKAEVAIVYNRLLAELRWSFVALEHHWLRSHLLHHPGDIFFLEYAEIKQLLAESADYPPEKMQQLISQRQTDFHQQQQLILIPGVVYGNFPSPIVDEPVRHTAAAMQGIGASPGCCAGPVKVIRNLQALPEIAAGTILVVPYTDAGWAPLLARAGGLISEVGGRLSHGAIVAREYGIPAIMDVDHATQLLQDGQQVRIDGQRGTIEILEDY